MKFIAAMFRADFRHGRGVSMLLRARFAGMTEKEARVATIHFKTSNIARVCGGAVIALGALFHSASLAQGTDEPIRARQALGLAVARYKSGELEEAAKYFALAQMGKKHLTTPDQQDLDNFSAQNQLALKNRQVGAEQIRFALEAVRKGQPQEAAGFVSALNANPHLTPTDREKLAELNRMVQAQPAPVALDPSKMDAKSLLTAGRAALQAGDLAGAENLAIQAEKAGSGVSVWMQPWSDSPAKLRRDVQSAMAKQQQPFTTVKNDAEPKDSSWLPGMKWFSKGEAPKNPDSDPSKSSGTWGFGGAKKDAAPSEGDRIARQIVADGYRFLEMNDLEKARMFAMQAKSHNAAFGPNEPTPDTLLHEIQRRSSNPNAPLTATAKKPGEIITNGDPRVMLKLARNVMQQKRFDDADKLCTQAQGVKGVSWGLFEDTPEKCLRDIARLRQANDREESVKVMADARKLFSIGQYEEAEKKAYLAQKMHGPYGVFDFGDRPSKLLEELNRIKPAKGWNDGVAKNDTPLPDGPNKVGPNTPIPAEMQAAKNRAIVMVREARELERQGMLVEARHKANEARTLRVTFLPEEDSPDAVVGSISAKCEKQIQMMLQQATESVTGNDPQRFEKANAQIGHARQLAQAFNLDASRIDQATQYLQQVASGTAPKGGMQFVGLTKQDIPTGDPQKDAMRKLAREKLQHAQTELSHGKPATARKMAEELYHPQYGIQEDVLRLLRSIAAEEHNQQILQAKRNFDAGIDAFVAKDYRQAMTVFQSIDPMTLPEPYQSRLRDIMATREMQPQAIVQAGHQQTLKGEKIDATNPGVAPVDRDNLIEETRAREIVQYQALRARGIEAVRVANEQFKLKGSENKDQAIDTLNHYMKQVADAGLEPAKANDLRRLPESRIQQYRMLMAQDKLDSRSRNNNMAMYHDESAYQGKIAGRQQEVYEQMKVVNELMKQNKLQEARAAVQRVREIDRDNVAALAAERILETRINQESFNRGLADNADFFLKNMPHKLSNHDVNDEKPIAFSKDVIDRRRTSPSGEIPWQNKDLKERAIEYRLKQPISLNFKDVPLRQAIKDIAIQSGVQAIPDLGPLQDERVNLDAPLSISVEDIEMRAALNILLNPMKLTYVIEDQVLKITTENRTKKRNIRVTYPIADLVIQVENHPLPDVLNILKALERTMSPSQFQMSPLMQPAYPLGQGAVATHSGGGLGSSFGSQAPNQPGYQMTQDGQTPKRNPEQMADLLMTLVKNAVQKQSWEDMGGNGVIQFFGPGLALVINQPQEVQEEVQQLLASLRKLQDLQVSVELRAVLVSESFFERIGVDFDMNIRTPTNRNEPNLLTGTFVQSPFANRTADKLGGLISGLTSAGTLTPDLNLPIRNSTFNFTTPQFGGYQPEAGLSLGLAFFSDIQVFMFLEAVQGDRRAHIMQAPKLTVYNGQQATIGGFMTRPSVTSLAAQPLGNGTFVMVPVTTQIPFGLGMTVQPVVSPDRRFIRLNVSPQQIAQVQDPTASIRLPVPVFAGALFDGGTPQVPFANNPLNFIEISQSQTNLTIANTTVNVPDGGTVLLGGFKFLAEERSEYGPPVLSKIPYLSRLFRNVGWSRDGSTLIYLITARVIMVEEEEQLFLGQIPPIPGR